MNFNFKQNTVRLHKNKIGSLKIAHNILRTCILHFALLGSSLYLHAASSEPDGFEAGVLAVRQGNYAAAREIFGNVLAGGEDDREVALARAYSLVALNDQPAKVPAGVVKVIREESSREDLIFQVMEARLHLLGLHPESNAAVGIKLIKAAAVEDCGYALYTWGLHLEGMFGGPKDVKQAGSKYQLAKDFGFKEALTRLGAIRRELDRMDATAGGWGDGASTWDDVFAGGDDESSTWKDGLDRASGDKGLEGGSAYTKPSAGGAAKKPSPGLDAVSEELSESDDDRTTHSNPKTVVSGSASTAAAEAALVAEQTRVAQLEEARRADAEKITQLETARREGEAAAKAQREKEAEAAAKGQREKEAALEAERARVAKLEADQRAAAARIAQLEGEARSRVATPAGGGASSARPPVVAAPAPAAAIVPVPRVPAIATGHEALYLRLLGGRLEYRPTKGSDAGLVVLPFRDILAPRAGSANPLSAAFDLSRCGDAKRYLSINIGYKKERDFAHEDKVEVWICPKFLVERELETFKVGGGIFSKAKHPFAKIMDEWKASVGYFWTWGCYSVGSDNYDYLLKGIAMDNDKNLYEKWRKGDPHFEQPDTTGNWFRNRHDEYTDYAFSRFFSWDSLARSIAIEASWRIQKQMSIIYNVMG